MGDLVAKKEILSLYLPAIIITIIVKWIMIQHGLPYATHVDELSILTDSFKIIQMYANGDFSVSTNLFNWVCIGWYGFIFLTGLLLGKWHSVEEFRTFLISGSPDFLLYGRMLAALLSLLGTIVLVRLVSRLKTDISTKILSTGLIVFNPFELNATNWAKFDALSYLAYALIIYTSYRYFIEHHAHYRTRLYLLLFAGLSARIEMVAFLIGIFIYDLFFFSPFSAKNIPWKAMGLGIALYCVVTLVPVSFLFNLYFSSASTLAVTPTFYDAIISKIPPFRDALRIVGESVYYFKCLVALWGPLILVDLFLNYKIKQVRFLYGPLAILLGVLFIFPIKNVHYLLGVSVIIVIAYILCSVNTNFIKWRRFSLLVSFIWVVTYSFQLIFYMIFQGDVRLDARDYVLRHTQPAELVYAEGIFASIYDTPDRYLRKSQASKMIGGTGLSNEYIAHHINPAESRIIVSVSDWEPFKGTEYENVFNNFYDSLKLRSDKPNYYIYVAPSFWQLDFSQNPIFDRYYLYYRFLTNHYTKEKMFSYNVVDPRLRFVNAYYLRPVIVFHKKNDW